MLSEELEVEPNPIFEDLGKQKIGRKKKKSLKKNSKKKKRSLKKQIKKKK
jgi:hypothetical protein